MVEFGSRIWRRHLRETVVVSVNYSGQCPAFLPLASNTLVVLWSGLLRARLDERIPMWEE
jgi:hypothetical protein